MKILCLVCLMMLLSSIMLLMNFILSKKMNESWEKCSPFECGMDAMSLSRQPFSMQFFMVTIVFLVFDVEISLMLPLISNENYYYYMELWFGVLILIILLLGLFIEWKDGALDWLK
uniref:NADH-ubiquinone oxidoreductase chain 3 n=1 Tax=Wiebesia pumilae TaxID=150944 RepID=A0A8A3UXN1_9HYME|nr:NADH dehydrogenase subunit 3 [Wiebesia pumilae]